MTKSKQIKTAPNIRKGMGAAAATVKRAPKNVRSATTVKPFGSGKIEKITALLRRPKGATIADMIKATDWQAHSVRGAISGTIKKKLGLTVTTEKSGAVRTYRIAG